MALANNTTPGSIVLAGDLTGNANAPELRPTGVVPGTYATSDIVVDSRGRLVSSQASGSSSAEYGTKGVVQVSQSSGLDLTTAILSAIPGTNASVGVVKSGNTSNVSISAGSVDVGPNIPLTTSLNVFTKSIRNAYVLSSGISLTPSFQDTSIYNFSSGSTLPIVNNPSTYVDGDAFTITTTSTAAGSNPISVAGYQVVDVGGSKTTGSSTGLTALNITGYQIVNVGGSKTTGSATGLNSTQDSNGYQTVNVGSNKVTGSATGLDTSTASAAHHTINTGSNKTGASATGLSGVTQYVVSVTVNGLLSQGWFYGTDGTTYTQLIATLNANLTADGADATWSLVSGDLSCTSNKTGNDQTVTIDWATIVTGYEGYTNIAVAVGTNYAAVAGTGTQYTGNVAVDGTNRAFTINSAAGLATYTGLMSALSAAIGSYLTFSLVSGNLRVASNAIGPTSTVSIGASTIFTTLTGYTSYGSAVAGTAATVYTATVQWNSGVTSSISIKGSAAQTYTALINEINADIGANGSATLTAGNVKLTSALSGNGSTVVITNTNLFNALTGYVSILTGVPGASYIANISVNGTLHAVDCGSSAIPLYSDLITIINSILSTTGTASMSGGNLVITSATSGSGSTVSILPTNLFTSLTNYGGIRTAIPGSTQYDYVTTFGNMYKFSNTAPHSQTQTFSGIVNNNKCYCTYQQ